MKRITMNERSHSLVKIRPELANAKITETMSDEEHFQNQTLRPIIKLQNMLLLSVFQNYIVKRKNSFYELNLEKRMSYITHAIQKDLKLRNSVKGMIVGHFTIEEYDNYIKNSSEINKRIINMVIKRIQDQIQYFEKEVLI